MAGWLTWEVRSKALPAKTDSLDLARGVPSAEPVIVRAFDPDQKRGKITLSATRGPALHRRCIHETLEPLDSRLGESDSVTGSVSRMMSGCSRCALLQPLCGKVKFEALPRG
jgi:hypothetical protein